MYVGVQEAGFFDAFKPLAAFDELEEGKKPTQWWIRLLFGLGSAALLCLFYFFAPDRGQTHFTLLSLCVVHPTAVPVTESDLLSQMQKVRCFAADMSLHWSKSCSVLVCTCIPWQLQVVLYQHVLFAG